MGFKKTITLDNGIEVQDAYLKVSNISGDKNCITFNIGAYINKDSADNGGQVLKYFYNSFTPNLEETNFIAQTYQFVKGLDDFKDAIDC